jgi:hypothetical protein
MTNDDGRKAEGALERSAKAGAGAPSGVDGNGPGCSLIPGVGSSSLFSNSGRGVKLSVKILAGSMVLSAVGRALRMMA